MKLIIKPHFHTCADCDLYVDNSRRHSYVAIRLLQRGPRRTSSDDFAGCCPSRRNIRPRDHETPALRACIGCQSRRKSSSSCLLVHMPLVGHSPEYLNDLLTPATNEPGRSVLQTSSRVDFHCTTYTPQVWESRCCSTDNRLSRERRHCVQRQRSSAS